MKLTDKEKLFDVIQLAKDIYSRTVSLELQKLPNTAYAKQSFTAAEIFLQEQEKYVEQVNKSV